MTLLSEQPFFVHLVRQVEQGIRHYITHEPQEIWKGQQVMLKIDETRRRLNARLHTAAHLLGHVVEELYPYVKAFKSHSFPKEACVEFMGEAMIDAIQVQEKISQVVLQGLKIVAFDILPDNFEKEYYPLMSVVPSYKEFRAVRIGHYLPVPCGGTHVSTTLDIGNVSVLNVRSKEGRIKIAYEVT